MKVGSLCTGYGGLELSLPFPHDVAWQSEFDPHAARLLAARFPGVPNLGDLTAVDWSAVEPVDVLVAGFPCQPFSTAGRRKGTSDDRHLWPYIATAIDVLAPPLVLLENVRGLLSANAGRAHAEVVGTLADLGYVGRWGLVAASAAGAPHRRQRWFCVAHADGARLEGRKLGRDRSDERVAGQDGLAVSADATHLGHERHGIARRRWDGPSHCGVPVADATHRAEPFRPQGDGERAAVDGTVTGTGARDRSGHPTSGVPVVGRGAGAAWGRYEAAVARWEQILGRPAPPAVDLDRRLSPYFVEWMMGLPFGWVTDSDLSRTQQLKMLGNGVVPQQARLAWSLMGLADTQERAA